jgi:hypothetical protein
VRRLSRYDGARGQALLELPPGGDQTARLLRHRRPQAARKQRRCCGGVGRSDTHKRVRRSVVRAAAPSSLLISSRGRPQIASQRQQRRDLLGHLARIGWGQRPVAGVGEIRKHFVRVANRGDGAVGPDERVLVGLVTDHGIRATGEEGCQLRVGFEQPREAIPARQRNP